MTGLTLAGSLAVPAAAPGAALAWANAGPPNAAARPVEMPPTTRRRDVPLSSEAMDYSFFVLTGRLNRRRPGALQWELRIRGNNEPKWLRVRRRW